MEGGRRLTPAEGGWTPIWAPSALAFDDGYAVPRELTQAEIDGVIGAFARAAERVLAAGFRVIELHGAHGYLIHEFLSPLSNRRGDGYDGSFAGRCRLLLEIVAAVRAVWPEHYPLFVRISATDWVEGGWTADDSVALARLLGPAGVDLIDCSSGGNAPRAQIPLGPGYQTPFAERLRRETGIMTGAIGLITEPRQADEIVAEGRADVVLLARAELRDPYWPLHAAHALGVDVPWPPQYQRAKPPPAGAAG